MAKIISSTQVGASRRKSICIPNFDENSIHSGD